MEPVGGVYVSDERIALTYVRWTERLMTFVHLLDRQTFDYLGSEEVQGALYSGGTTSNQRLRRHSSDGDDRVHRQP